MNVVLLHDWLTGFRGGERVLEVFCELFPEAPLYTLIHRPGTTSATIEARKIQSSFLDQMPGVAKHYRKYLPLFPRAADSLKIIEKADLVLSSSHCVIKGVKKPAGSTHISYIHSPMRYLYDQYDAYFGKGAPLYQQWGARVFKNSLTKWDKDSNQNVDFMIANSLFVQQRIEKYYGRTSDVIHPFVDLIDFEQAPLREKKAFYVVVSAFAPNKRVDLAIKAFNELGLPLVVIGSGQKERELKEIAGPSIEFLGNVSRAVVVQKLQEAKAMIFPGVEDFGITPLEALTAGTPVIAYKKGGVLETLNENVAVFFEEADVDSLIAAVKGFEARKFEQKILKARARDFSKEIFKEKMKTYIEQKVQKK